MDAPPAAPHVVKRDGTRVPARFDQITDRNAAALAVLEKRIARGDRRIAIFYGAAHMDDFDRRLREDFSLQPGETVWLEAWDLREPAPRK